MKKLLFIVLCICCFTRADAQEIISDEYWEHNVRKITTNEIIVPTKDDNTIVKLHLWHTMHKKSVLDQTIAEFTIDYKKSTIGTISPYYCILKTKSGKIIESQNELAKQTYSNVPKGWWRLEWDVRLDKKNLKEFIKEPISKIRLQIGFSTQILDIDFEDETLTNYIREANNAIQKQRKIKIDESKNRPKYDDF